MEAAPQPIAEVWNETAYQQLQRREHQQLARLQLHLWGYAGTGLSLLGIAGNAVSIRVLCSRRMLSSTSIYLAAQGCLDTAVLLLFDVCMGLPLVSDTFARLARPDSALIMILYPLSLFIHMCSMYVATCFTVERCLSARFPLREAAVPARRSRRRTRRRLLAILAFSLVYNAPRGLEKLQFGGGGGGGGNGTAPPTWSLQDSWWYRGIYSGVMYSLFMYVVPLALISVSNAILVHTVRRSTQRAAVNGSRPSNLQHQKRLERDRSISRMLAGVVAVFVFCQTFALVDNLTAVALQTPPNQPSTWQQAFYLVAQFFIVVNSSVNFILYCFFGRKFRRELSAICGCCGGDGQQQQGGGGSDMALQQYKHCRSQMHSSGRVRRLNGSVGRLNHGNGCHLHGSESPLHDSDSQLHGSEQQLHSPASADCPAVLHSSASLHAISSKRRWRLLGLQQAEIEAEPVSL